MVFIPGDYLQPASIALYEFQDIVLYVGQDSNIQAGQKQMINV